MNGKLAIAGALLVLATSGCSTMSSWMGGNGGNGGGNGDRNYMGGSAPTMVDPAGTATFGTGSVSSTNADSRVDFSSGIGLDD